MYNYCNPQDSFDDDTSRFASLVDSQMDVSEFILNEVNKRTLQSAGAAAAGECPRAGAGGRGVPHTYGGSELHLLDEESSLEMAMVMPLDVIPPRHLYWTPEKDGNSSAPRDIMPTRDFIEDGNQPSSARALPPAASLIVIPPRDITEKDGNQPSSARALPPAASLIVIPPRDIMLTRDITEKDGNQSSSARALPPAAPLDVIPPRDVMDSWTLPPAPLNDTIGDVDPVIANLLVQYCKAYNLRKSAIVSNTEPSPTKTSVLQHKYKLIRQLLSHSPAVARKSSMDPFIITATFIGKPTARRRSNDSEDTAMNSQIRQ